MEKILQVLRIILLFILLPFEICKGAKKRAYMNIKMKMIAADIL